ncbi:head maturation protease, ClpP-related [Enterococcus hirae]|uniref:head maturation protease, ClpP-related n=1 Tax=Enterococcus TaxID=1350 RepID=UPI0002A2F867|nr:MULTISPECIES: head maturation protease, ClpP-related [Enterococcus]EGP4892197.1 Clp protease ClpP [Enterococcus faecium]ELB12729.1 ATP-dependent Clp protease, proteolytic subunit ClpP [Enterococcus faecium EnGen0032]EME3574447.1 Clp protease ClpP [Enterococcus faecium]EME8074380.1 Clp protease ClpP [Enterococcus faecium]KEI57682.1 Clp protease ClpP [Enterococcus faecium UC10237]
MKKFWECKQSANQNEADVFIFGEIVSFKWDDTDTTAASFQKDLKELGEVSQINLHINSPGGSVFEGIAIGNMLRQHKARVVAHVDALAASIASVIVASCDEVIMPENSMLMIHNPWTISMGNAKELRKQADDLDKIAESSVVTYLAKAGEKLTEEKIKQIMDEETWMSAQEAYNYGLCDVVESANQVAASISQKLFETYQKVPEKLLDSRQEDSRDQEKIEKIVEHTKQNKALIGTILGGL